MLHGAQRQWRSGVTSPKILGGGRLGGKMLDFRQISLFCLEKRLSKHKMTIFSKSLGGHSPFRPHWLRLCLETPGPLAALLIVIKLFYPFAFIV